MLIALFLSINITSQAQVTWTELVDSAGDVGSLIANAQDLTGQPYSVILGEFSVIDDIDIYKINITSADSFAATTEVNVGTHVDTELWLFDENGVGVYSNDDTPNHATDMSLLPRRTSTPGDSLGPVTNGVYYIAVSIYEVVAQDEDGAEIFENPRATLNWDRVNAPLSPKPLAGWEVKGTGGNPPGTYRITMTGTGGTFINLANENADIPNDLTVARAYPNPFTASSVVEFSVTNPQLVNAAVYNALGQKVSQIFDRFVAAGNQEQLHIDAADLPTGSYFVRIQGENFVSTQTVTVVK